LQFQEHSLTTKHAERHTAHARGIVERFNSRAYKIIAGFAPYRQFIDSSKV